MRFRAENSRRSRFSTWLVPWLLVPGCLLPSFERADGSGGQGGSAGRAGSSGRGGSGADNAAGAGVGGAAAGGAAGEAAAGGVSGAALGGEAGEGGSSGAADAAVLATREYVVDQGDSLAVTAQAGLLADARSEGWVRILGSAPRGDDDDALRLAKYDAEFSIEANGEFQFEPAPQFFGSYAIRYAAENDAGERAEGLLRVTVRPNAVEFATLADGIGGFAITGPRDDEFGRALAGVGDVDGDGYGDFLVGAPASDANAGAVYLFFGAPRLASFRAESEPDATTRYVVLKGAAGERFGTALAGAGDRNGDGLADLLIGAPGATGSDGRACLVYGRSRGDFGTTLSIDRALASDGGRIFHGAPSENAGEFVAAGADFTRDGASDLIVVGQLGRGRFYVVDGAGDGDLELDRDAARLLLGAGSIDVALGAVVVGDVAGDSNADLFVATRLTQALLYGPASNFPASLDSGDVGTNDGLFSPRSASNGQVSLASAGDFDHDGQLDLVACDELLADRCSIVRGDPAALDAGARVSGFAAGPVLVAGGGDSSGDDFSDLLFAETANAYVVYGRSQLGSTLPVDDLAARGFTLSGASGLTAVALGGELDTPLTAAGNHDDEWLLGDVDPGNGAGRVYVLFGAPYSR